MEHTITRPERKIFENKTKYRIMKNDLVKTMYGFISVFGMV